MKKKIFIYFGVVVENTLSTNEVKHIIFEEDSPLGRDIVTHLAELSDEIVQSCVINRTQCY